MLEFYRSMPRILLVQPVDFEVFDQFIREYPCFKLSFDVDINDGFQGRGCFDSLLKDSILIYTVEELTETSVDEGYRTAYIVDTSLDDMLMCFINSEYRIIERIRQTPQMAVLKTVGDIQKVIEKLLMDINGVRSAFSEVHKGRFKGSYVCFTEENIDKTLDFREFYPECIYTEMNFNDLISHLSKYSLKYVNVGLENKDWYELSIKIYDSYGRFKEQYNRLAYIIDVLNMGLIAGESWGRDVATMFLSVGIYKIKLFTYINPIEIKRVLVALEYDLDGKRLVDYDLFHRKKKIHWDLVKFEGINRKVENGIKAREVLEGKLTQEQIEKLRKMESVLR
jgi:hypothetical protein